MDRSSDPRIVRTRGRALEAAQALLMSDGLDAVTLQRVAEASGVGRRTMYRHWPDRRSLLHDTLALTSAPAAEPGADLRTGLLAHLDALDRAVGRGPLAYIVAALHERSVHDPEFDALRSELVDAGCAPLDSMLRAAIGSGELPSALDVRAAIATLEGPVFHAGLLHRSRLTRHQREQIVDRFLADPPRRGR
jgi:AcrR family transcriptional regulator